MSSYLARRLALAVLTIWGAVTVVFVVTRLLPSDPITILVGSTATLEEIEEARQRFGLDGPISTQYRAYMGALANLDFGQSVVARRPSVDVIRERLPATLTLAMTSWVFGAVIGVGSGVLAGMRQGSWTDRFISKLSLVAQSLPTFWVGIMLLIVFARTLGWLPSLGRGSLAHLILPSVTLALPLIAILARLTRQGILEVLNSNYVETARAKGLREATVVRRHMMKNMLIPVITVLGLQLGDLLTGAMIVETVFSWPGIGSLLISSITRQDYPVVQALMIFAAFVFVAVNLIVDLVYGALDPRVRLENR